MPRIILSSLVLSLLFIMIGCSPAEKTDYSVIEISPELATGHDWLSIADTTVVALETTEESLIGRIDEVYNDDTNWYILTGESSILKFDKSGKFVSSIGSKGNGPGECMRINTMCISGEEIYAIEGNQDKVCVYTTDGKWKQDIKDTECLKFAMAIQPLNDGKFLVANGISFKEGTPLYGIWDPAEPQQLLSVVESDYTSQGSYEWAMAPIATYKGEDLTLRPLSSTIYLTNTATAVSDSIINIANCIPENISTSGDYSSTFVEIVKQKGHTIMGIHSAGDFVFISLLRAFAMCHIPSGKWWYTDTSGISLQHSPLPFMLTRIVDTSDNQIVCAVDASTYMDVYSQSSTTDVRVEPEDNPVLMIYTVRFTEDL